MEQKSKWLAPGFRSTKPMSSGPDVNSESIVFELYTRCPMGSFVFVVKYAFLNATSHLCLLLTKSNFSFPDWKIQIPLVLPSLNLK